MRRFWADRWFALACGALLTLGLWQGPVAAQTKQVPSSPEAVQLSYAPIVKTVSPAVVNVYASHWVDQPTSPFAADPFFRQFFGDQFGGPTRKQQEQSLGSGVIVDPAGIIITNYHVIDSATEIRVALTDRREFDCTVLLKDKQLDLAVLKIKDAKAPLPIVNIGDSDKVEVGDLVLAIGNPFGVGQTVTHGIVSALARTEVGVADYQFFIQTDAAINPGNSGGALIDMSGRLVGINTAIYSKSGGSNGIGFAIPANMVKVVLASAAVGDKVLLPWSGADMQAVTADIAEGLGLDRPVGLIVKDLVAGSPAAQAGLQTGDVVVGIDGVEVSDPREYNYRLATKGVGKVVTLNTLRNGSHRDVSLKLVSAPETVPANLVTIKAESPFQGATVANLSPKIAQELSLTYRGETGVVITKLDDQSIAAQLGFEVGDVVLEVNGVTITSTSLLNQVANSHPQLWRLAVNRNGQVLRSTFR